MRAFLQKATQMSQSDAHLVLNCGTNETVLKARVEQLETENEKLSEEKQILQVNFEKLSKKVSSFFFFFFFSHPCADQTKVLAKQLQLEQQLREKQVPCSVAVFVIFFQIFSNSRW